MISLIRRLLDNWRAWQAERERRQDAQRERVRENRRGIDVAWQEWFRRTEVVESDDEPEDRSGRE